MKATGIVRRLDDLGRLVIPKEIRKIYRLKEGDSIEFFVSDDSEIIIRKYEHLSDHNSEISSMIEIFQDLFKTELYFYGDDRLTASSSLKRTVSEETLEKIKVYHEETLAQARLFSDDAQLQNITVFPLVVDSHWVGSFLLTAAASDSMRLVLNSFVRLLTRKMDE